MRLIGKILKALAPYIFQLFMHLLGWIKWWLDKNPEVRQKLDDFIIKNVGPWLKEHAFDIMQKYGEYTAKRAATEKVRTEEAGRTEAKRESKSTGTSEGVDSTEIADEIDLTEAASQTAHAGYEKARKIGGVASRKAGRLLADARRWLEDETGLNEDEDSDEGEESNEGGSSDEDNEISRLKRKLAKEERGTTARKTPEPVAPTADPKPNPKKPSSEEGKDFELNPQIGYADELQKMIDAERRERDSG